VNGTWICQEARMMKSAEEVAFLDKSIELIERSVDAMYRTARPGVRESEVYAWMLWDQVASGGDMPTLLSWLSGPWGRASQRLLRATTRVLEKDDMIFNEIESRYGGYCAQQVQPMCVGQAPREVLEMFDWQGEAFEAVREIEAWHDLRRAAGGREDRRQEIRHLRIESDAPRPRARRGLATADGPLLTGSREDAAAGAADVHHEANSA
jgi:Xaa-Pro aminopeptidase